MKTKITLLLLLVGGHVAFSQGFVNLNFEDADLTGYSVGDEVPSSNAFPGWTINAAFVLYDNFSLSGESISLIDTNPAAYWEAFSTIQGNYFMFFVSANYPGTGVPTSVGQIGTIPPWAQSITFWGSIGGMQVTFDGNPLYFSAIGSGSSYTIYGADISAYANQTGELLFTLPPYVGNASLDNIQFSSTAVPEPSTLALSAFGGLLVVWRRRWKASII